MERINVPTKGEMGFCLSFIWKIYRIGTVDKFSRKNVPDILCSTFSKLYQVYIDNIQATFENAISGTFPLTLSVRGLLSKYLVYLIIIYMYVHR